MPKTAPLKPHPAPQVIATPDFRQKLQQLGCTELPISASPSSSSQRLGDRILCLAAGNFPKHTSSLQLTDQLKPLHGLVHKLLVSSSSGGPTKLLLLWGVGLEVVSESGLGDKIQQVILLYDLVSPNSEVSTSAEDWLAGSPAGSPC